MASRGRRPTLGSGWPKDALSAAMTRSQPSTISNPPPSASPFTLAMTGTDGRPPIAMPPNPWSPVPTQ